ncbi:MAG: NUDIX hydrolase [Bacteroidetes bacterium]|nr:MAG: NUDIX hydrolase [Bacteroidota bacterium]PTM09709.1 MAG: NUDIX hydrolase [Bacteroidota bacterium]
MRIRNSVKAIVLQDGRLLCNQNQDQRGIFYCLPGGGQEYQENLREAVVRECLEEVSARVEVGELLFVRDYIGRNHAGQERLQRVHQVEFFFRCQLAPEAVPALGTGADRYQTGVSWLPLTELEAAGFYPKDLIPWLFDLAHPERPVYLGDMD